MIQLASIIVSHAEKESQPTQRVNKKMHLLTDCLISVLAYVSSVEDPTRFSRSRSVGAHFGLTPKQYQSGEIDRSGRISKYGDSLTRTLMYEAATVLLRRVKRPSSLQDWAQAIARRSGEGKARVALARKLSVILHSIWRSGEPFRWSELQVAA